MRKFFIVLIVMGAVSAVGLVVLRAQVIQTQQPVVADTSGTTVAKDDTVQSVLTELQSNEEVRVVAEATNTGGQTLFPYTTTASVNTSGITTTATGVYTIWAFNPTETEAFLFLHNDNTPICNLGTDLAFSMGIPPSPAAGQQGGFLIPLTVPITGNFTTALGFCVKGDDSATSNTAAPAGILIGIGYKIAS